MMRQLLSGTLLFVCIGLVAGSASADAISDYNLVVFNDLDSTSEVEGATLVGGSLTGSAASNYGIKLTPKGDYEGVTTLTIGGDINTGASATLEAGDALLGGSINGLLILNGTNPTSTVGDSGVSSIVSSAVTEVENFSSYLQSLGGTSVSTPGPADQPISVLFNTTGVTNTAGVAVFSVDGEALFENSKVQNMSLSLGTADYVVINVGGTDIAWSASGDMIGDFNTANAADIIWNFYEATSIDMGKASYGAILAPDAHLSGNGGAFEGSVFVNSFTQRKEVHLPYFDGAGFPVEDPPVVPEPSTLALMGLGLTAGALARRRRKNSMT